MSPAQRICLGPSSLTVEVQLSGPFVVGMFSGVADESAVSTLLDAAEMLVTADALHVVMDFARLREADDWSVEAVARLIREAHRLCRNVTLVRCDERLFARLGAAGLCGVVTHSGSLAAATDGRLGDSGATFNLYLRSETTCLTRLRAVVGVAARRQGLSDAEVPVLYSAIQEACVNAIRHGSPLGERNHVLVSFHHERDALIVEVADQGAGFHPLHASDGNGDGISRMRQSLDRLEYFAGETGTVVRMTKYVSNRLVGASA